MELTLQLAFRIAIVWAGGFLLAWQSERSCRSRRGLPSPAGRPPSLFRSAASASGRACWQPLRLRPWWSSGPCSWTSAGVPSAKATAAFQQLPAGIAACKLAFLREQAQKTERAARQQGSSFLRENSSNGGKTIRTFWLHSRGGGRECQEQIGGKISSLK